MNTGLLLFLVFAFLATFLLVGGLYLLWVSRQGQEAQRFRQRLERIATGTTGMAEAVEESTLARHYRLSNHLQIDAFLKRLPGTRRLYDAIARTGISLGVDQLIGYTLAAALLPPLAALLLGASIMPALILSGIVLLIPRLWLARKTEARLRTIEAQLPDALDLISRALKAGHAFSTGLKLAADEGPQPIASEFRITFEEINFGVSMQQALNNLAHRVASRDLQYFVIAVLIQRETGGNLTEILNKISRLIRERMKLLGQIRVLTADGRLSAWILVLLPVSVAVIIHYLNPGYLDPLWTSSSGHRLMMIIFFMMLLGVLWIRSIIRIRV